MEQSPSHLVSHLVLLADFSQLFFEGSTKIGTENGHCCSGVVNGPRAPHHFTSLWLFLQPTHSRSSTPVCLNQPSLLPFRLTSRPDFKGRFLSPATFDSADEDVTTEVYTIPIALVNHTLYDLG